MMVSTKSNSLTNFNVDVDYSDPKTSAENLITVSYDNL